MTYEASKRKLAIELILMWPFVIVGKLIGHIFPLKTKHSIFFILPNRDIGGSPQVNLDLLACCLDKNPIVIFTKKANNNLFAEHYATSGVKVLDISQWIDHKWLHFINFIFRGIISTWVHANKEATVFGGECIYFYKLVPHLKNNINKVELCHLPTWISYTKAFAPFINQRVTSTAYLKRQIEAEYHNTSVPAEYLKNLLFVENAIDIPQLKKSNNERLEVFFIGRGAPQKRVHLIIEIAKKVKDSSLPIHFNFVGDVSDYANENDLPFCTFYGNVKDQDLMQEIYEKADLLLLTSKNEGLPVVVMQMMALGKVVIVTAIDALPDYITDKETGFLIHSKEETEIVKEAVTILKEIANNPIATETIQINARKLAVEKFNKKDFCTFWRKIFNF